MEKITTTAINKMRAKSVASMPDNPSEGGYTADDIKQAMTGHILDINDSIVSEINRIVAEGNTEDTKLEERLNQAIDKKINKADIVQGSGSSQTQVMSQNAVTEKFDTLTNIVDTKVNKIDIVQGDGTSTTKVMSQNAVTNELNVVTNELNKKINKTDIVQGSGSSQTQVMSQSAVTNALGNKIDNWNVTQDLGDNPGLIMSQNAVTNELDAVTNWLDAVTQELQSVMSGLNKKIDKADIVQGSGTSTTQVMSQKAVTDRLRGSVVVYDKFSPNSSLNWGYPNGMKAFRRNDTANNYNLPSGFNINNYSKLTFFVDSEYAQGFGIVDCTEIIRTRLFGSGIVIADRPEYSEVKAFQVTIAIDSRFINLKEVVLSQAYDYRLNCYKIVGGLK